MGTGAQAAGLAGRVTGMQVRVAVSEAARETALRSSKGEYEVLYNGVDVERFSRGRARADGPARRSCSSAATRRARG